MNNYFKSFVIGSSALVFAPFFVAAHNFTIKNYNYYHYTLLAPIFFGLTNMLSLLLAKTFKLNLRKRYILISILSSVSTLLYVTLSKSYDFSKNSSGHFLLPNNIYQYYLSTFTGYMFVWNIVIYNIEKYLMCKK